MSTIVRQIRINNPYDANVFTKSHPDLTDCGMGAAHPSGLSDSESSSRCHSPVTPDHGAEHLHPESTLVEVAGATNEEVDGEGMGPRPASSSMFYEQLQPQLPFYAYETMELSLAGRPLDSLRKLFVGQVPYHLAPPHVAWILYVLSGGRPVFHVEKIIKWTENKRACGCFHVWVLPEDIECFTAAHQTTLCEEEGMWVSRSPTERGVLVDWCQHLCFNRAARAPLMPYQMVTVEVAVSDYRRPHGRRSRHRNEAANARPLPSAPATFSAVCCFPTHTTRPPY